MTEVDRNALVQQVAQGLSQQLMEEARLRAAEVARGLEQAPLAGLIVQKYGMGMARAVAAMAQALDAKCPSMQQSIDAATALVDPNWLENMRARWQAKADIDLSTPRPPAARG